MQCEPSLRKAKGGRLSGEGKHGKRKIAERRNDKENQGNHETTAIVKNKGAHWELAQHHVLRIVRREDAFLKNNEIKNAGVGDDLT